MLGIPCLLPARWGKCQERRGKNNLSEGRAWLQINIMQAVEQLGYRVTVGDVTTGRIKR